MRNQYHSLSTSPSASEPEHTTSTYPAITIQTPPDKAWTRDECRDWLNKVGVEACHLDPREALAKAQLWDWTSVVLITKSERDLRDILGNVLGMEAYARVYDSTVRFFPGHMYVPSKFPGPIEVSSKIP
ncbi:uncharacterized protein LY89DRAFT_214216 [Mollisia scopiformis]|uniref:SAM domain-containing protein n=1 Tax=Mollisia scopiformis TaxID=149040 RepID=A0A194WWA0_MOLSC|nr:uncharacterized protein LY89DRAFT_214216 [Mollisia scopiformis]KUJ11857.1 hypothetical protein LY89DRAFT_214216 [Mollisia scopiformis]